jgi:hypothetical protein
MSKNNEHARNQHIRNAAVKRMEEDSTSCKRLPAQWEIGREVPAHRKLERSNLYAPSVALPAIVCDFACLVQLRLYGLAALLTLYDDGGQRQWTGHRPWTEFFVDVYCRTAIQRSDMHAMTPLGLEN